MKKTFIAGFFIFLLGFTAALITPLVLMMEYGGRAVMDAMEKIAPLMPQQKLLYFKLLGESEEHFLTAGIYLFFIAFLASLFLGNKFLRAIRDLRAAANAVNGGKPAPVVPLLPGGELEDIGRAFNNLSRSLREKDTELARKNGYINTMMDALWVINDENLVMEVNPALTSLLGYEPEDILNYSVFEFVDEEGEKILRKHLLACSQGKGSSCEVQLISKQGGLKPVIISWSPVFDGGGEVVNCLGILKDFSRESGLRSTLKEALDYQRAIMDSIPDRLLVLDGERRIIMANKTANDAAGGGLEGKLCHTVFGCGDCTPAGCPVLKALDTGMPQSETVSRLKGQEQVFFEVIAYPVKSVLGRGPVRNCVVIFRDISEKKRFEKEMGKKDMELGSLLDISMTLNLSLTGEEVFNPALEKFLDLMGMDGGCIFLLDEMGKELACKYSKGLSAGFLEVNGTFKAGEDIPGMIVSTGRPFTAPDLTADPRAEASVFRHTGMRACLAVPMQGKEKINGVILLFSISRREWTDADEDLMEGAGRAAGMALENIRRYEKMRQLYNYLKWRKDEEKKRLIGIAASVAGMSGADRMLSNLLTVLKDVTHADFIWLLERAESGELVVRSAPGSGISKGLAPYEDGEEGIEEGSLERGSPLLASAEQADSDFKVPVCLEGEKFRAACAIPVLPAAPAGQSPKWVIGLYYRSFRQPGPEDLSFFQTVAFMLNVALEKAELQEEAAGIGKGMAGAILESIDDGIIAVDPHGNVMAMNKSAAALAGMAAADAPGRIFTSLFPDSAGNARLNLLLIEGLTESLKGRHTYRQLSMTANGARSPILLASHPVADDAGRVESVIFVLRDLARNREITSFKSEFAKNVSQEFRDPVSAIIGLSEMLLDGEAPAGKEAGYLKAVLAEGQQLERIITDYLNMAEMEGGPERLRIRAVDIRKLISEVAQEYGPAARRKRIDISVVIKDGLQSIEGDPEKLKYLLRNLLENSITYSGEKSSVEIAAQIDADEIEMAVRDTGWGVPEAEVKNMGKKFFRGSNALDIKGTGLGLSLSKQIVRMHGGTINIDSTAGAGTTIRLRLPLRRRPGEQNNGD